MFFSLIVEVSTIAEYMLGCFKAIYFPLLVTMFHYFGTIFAIFADIRQISVFYMRGVVLQIHAFLLH